MYVMEDCYCPQCKQLHKHPVNGQEKPPVHRYDARSRTAVLRVVCHDCTTSGLSPDTRKQYDTIFERIVRKCLEAHGTLKKRKPKS